MFFAPLAANAYVKVTARRTKKDLAQCMRDLVDVHFPSAVKIILVQDNLNTHTRRPSMRRFPPAEARRILEKLEFHYTPKHGSWLNMAEIELSVLSRQCLDRRIGKQAELEREIAAWQAKRNALLARINWRFTTADARIRLRRLYPCLEDESPIK